MGSRRAQRTSTVRVAFVAVVAALGLAFGSALRARGASACDGGDSVWQVRLERVDGNDPDAAPQSVWPNTGTRSTSGRWAEIDAALPTAEVWSVGGQR